MRRALVLAACALAVSCRPAPIPDRVGIMVTTQVAADYLSWAAGDAVSIGVVVAAGQDPFRDPPDASALAAGRWQAILSLGTAWEEPIIVAAAAAAPGTPMLRLPLPLVTSMGGDGYWMNPIYAERLLDNAGAAISGMLPARGEEIEERVFALQTELEEFNLAVRIHKGPGVDMPVVPLRIAAWSRLPVDFILYAGYTPWRTMVAFPADSPPGGLAGALAGEAVVPDLIVASEQAPEWLEEEALRLGIEVVRLAVFPADLDPRPASPRDLLAANWERLRAALWRLAGERPG